MNVGILDLKGIPYSEERFATEPDLAQEFLEVYETNSVGILPNWREFTSDRVMEIATFRLNCMIRDLERAESMRRLDKLQ